MELEQQLDQIIRKEKQKPTFSHHHINSYLTNLPVDSNNDELMNILHYFDSDKDFLCLYQDKEFKNGLTIEVKCEMIDDYDLQHGINYRESLYHNHDFFEIIFVYQGQCETMINNKKITLHEKEVCLFNLQAVHKLIISNSNTVVFNILIGKELLTETFLLLFQNTNFVSSFFISSVYNISTYNGFLVIPLAYDSQYYMEHLILEFIKKDTYYKNIMQSDFISFLLCITRYIENSVTYISKTQHDIEVETVLNYIYENYNHLSLSELANHFGYSNRTMMRYLKKNMKCSFTSIVKECKLNNARDYLLHSDYGIDRIAEITGFSDRSHFDKIFKNNYHITPKLYREKYRD